MERYLSGFAKFVVEPYLGFLPHQDPLSFVTWTYLAAGAELAGAVGLTLGLLTRLSVRSIDHHVLRSSTREHHLYELSFS